ncbi:MAG TPA: TetR/AcrR family transcriptional regulator [Kofleriaceae bacterium]|jgi:AcrR family transcriptional regulator
MPKRAYHHGNLGPALIDAGLHAIAEHGPDNFSLRDVARRAGVSAPAVYRHFVDKESLLAAIAVDCSVRIRAIMDDAIALAPPDPLLRFRAQGIAYVRFAVRHPHHFRAMTIPGLTARMPPQVARDLQFHEVSERAALEEGQRDGLIAPVPIDELLLAALSIVHGLAMLIIQGELGEVGEARAVELASQVTEVLGVGLFPRVPADPLSKPPPAAKPPSAAKPPRHANDAVARASTKRGPAAIRPRAGRARR